MAYKRISTKLPFHASDIYNIIIDVASYPEFIPHCNAIEIHSQSEIEIIATMHINYITILKNIHFSYTSQITLDASSYKVFIEEHPKKFFKVFENIWEVRPTVDGCEIIYDIKFEIKNALLNLTLSSLVLENSSKIVEAFTKRAYKTLIPIK